MAAQTWQPSTFRGCGHVGPLRHWQLPLHAHDDMAEMIVVLGGAIETRIQGQTLRGSRGDVLLYPAAQPHAEAAVGDEPLETAFFAFAPGAPMPGPLLRFDREGRIEQAVRWMLDAPHDRPGGGPLLLALAVAACHEFARLGEAGRESGLELTIRRYIRSHIGQPLTLDDLAAQAALSRYHFVRAFRAATGLTPMRYLRRMRVEAGRALLVGTPLPLKAIAAQVGFADRHHFARAFRQETGRTPGSLRRPGV